MEVVFDWLQGLSLHCIEAWLFCRMWKTIWNETDDERVI